MSDIICNFLKGENHASKVLIGGSVVIMAVGLVGAVIAILFMK